MWLLVLLLVLVLLVLVLLVLMLLVLVLLVLVWLLLLLLLIFGINVHRGWAFCDHSTDNAILSIDLIMLVGLEG